MTLTKDEENAMLALLETLKQTSDDTTTRHQFHAIKKLLDVAAEAEWKHLASGGF